MAIDVGLLSVSDALTSRYDSDVIEQLVPGPSHALKSLGPRLADTQTEFVTLQCIDPQAD
jgi:hypothetical protein